MKAILYHRFGGREVLELEEISAPTPAEGELLIEVERAGVNFVDIRDDWPQQVREKTGGRGVDLILESVGGDIFEKNFDCLAPCGRCLIYGSTRGRATPGLLAVSWARRKR